MVTNELLETSLRLLQHIERLVGRSIVDERSRLLIQVLLEQLRSEIKIGAHACENHIKSIRQASRHRLARRDHIKPEPEHTNCNRIASSSDSMLVDAPQFKDTPMVAGKQDLIVSPQAFDATNEISTRQTLVAINRRNRPTKTSANQTSAVQHHFKIIRTALDSTQEVARLVEKMATLSMNDG